MCGSAGFVVACFRWGCVESCGGSDLHVWASVFCDCGIIAWSLDLFGVVCVPGLGGVCVCCGLECMLWPLFGRGQLDVLVVLCCDASRSGGCGVGLCCVCGVPGLIRLVWCRRLCFE